MPKEERGRVRMYLTICRGRVGKREDSMALKHVMCQHDMLRVQEDPYVCILITSLQLWMYRTAHHIHSTFFNFNYN